MASYRKRQSGRWQAQIRRKGYRPQTRSFRTKTAAEAWVRSIETEMDQGCFLPQNEVARTTLGELLERYRREVTIHICCPSFGLPWRQPCDRESYSNSGGSIST
jgi:hypothetical protein